MSIVNGDGMIKTAKNDITHTEAVEQEIALLFTSCCSRVLQASGPPVSKFDVSFGGDHELVSGQRKKRADWSQ